MSRKLTKNEAILIKQILNQKLQQEGMADKLKAWKEKRKAKKAAKEAAKEADSGSDTSDPVGSERPGEEWRTGKHRKDTETWSRGGVDKTIQPSGKGYQSKKMGGSDVMRALKQQHADDTAGRNDPPKEPRDAGGDDSGGGSGGGGGNGGDDGGGGSEKEQKAVSGGGNELKKLSQGRINVALNQLRNKGIGAKKLSSIIDAAVEKIAGKAGPQKDNFIKRDLPTIKLIKKQLVAILSGDFSALKESNNHYMVDPHVYAIINEMQPQKVIRRTIVKNLTRVTGQSEEKIRNMIMAQPTGVDKRKAHAAQAIKESIKEIRSILKAEGYVVTESAIGSAIGSKVKGLVKSIFGKTRLKSGGGLKSSDSTFSRTMKHLRKTDPALYKDTMKDLTDSGAIDNKDSSKKKKQDRKEAPAETKKQAIKESFNNYLIHEVLKQEKVLLEKTLYVLRKRCIVK